MHFFLSFIYVIYSRSLLKDVGWKKSELGSFEGKEMVVEGTQVVAKNYYDVMALVLRGNFLPYYVIILIAVYFSFFLFFPVPFEISAVQLVWNVYVAHTTGLMSTGTATLLNKTKAVKDVHLFFFFFLVITTDFHHHGQPVPCLLFWVSK